MTKNIISSAVMGLAIGVGVVGGLRVFPMVTKMESTISVTGEARSKQKNQLATFNAGVNLVKDKREDATNEMNSKMKALSESLKTFGIKSEDIKIKHTFANFVPHQYLQVKVAGVWIDVDPAGVGIRKKPLGTHLSWFG
jgi:uncharacterized protein YggE